jgi:hypothetical protein
MLRFAISASLSWRPQRSKHLYRSGRWGLAEATEKNFHSADLFIILTRDLVYGRFRTRMETESRGPKTSTQCRLVSDNVQLFHVTFVKFARAVGRYGSSCSSLRGMPEMLHSLFDWIQSVPQRLVLASDRERFVYGMDALLLLWVPCELEPVELQ